MAGSLSRDLHEGPPTSERTRPILIADDDPGSRAAVEAALRRAGYPTRHAATGSAALEAAARDRPALVILETHLPDESGYEICRELRDRYGESVPIVFVSARRTEEADRVAGLLLGADDYLPKPVRPDHLLARVRRLLARSAPVTPSVAEQLTAREREVLALLAEGLEPGEIAGRLFITRKTVAKHIERILAKLGVHSRAQAIALALRRDGGPLVG